MRATDKLLIAVDPGLKTSGTGITFFIGETVIKTVYCPPLEGTNFQGWMTPIVDAIEFMLTTLLKHNNYKIIVEESFYQGTANKLHQRFIGVLLYHFPEMDFIAPLSVKKIVTGSGKSDKEEVKRCLLVFFKDREDEFNVIDWSSNDVVDSVGVGVAYMNRNRSYDFQ